jgi:branched-chain amino acid transport system permease protein
VITLLAIVTDGLVYAAWLFVVAIGLSLIFGVMKILNVAHGAFYAFGAYVAATAIGLYYDKGLPVAGGYAAIAGAAVLTGLVMGYVLERVFLRRAYGRDEVVAALITYSLFLILEDVLILIWGALTNPTVKPAVSPSADCHCRSTISGLSFLQHCWRWPPPTPSRKPRSDAC